MLALFTVLFVRVDHQAVGVPQPFLSAAPVPAVPRAQRFQATGARFACQGAIPQFLRYVTTRVIVVSRVSLTAPCQQGAAVSDTVRRCQCLQACLMLSLEATYPPAYQLALDMLKVSR